MLSSLNRDHPSPGYTGGVGIGFIVFAPLIRCVQWRSRVLAYHGWNACRLQMSSACIPHRPGKD
jgi:hypothetical protein